MLLADEGLSSAEGTKGKDSKSSVEELVKNFLQIHESCSDKDAAPRRYMTFLKTYKRVYNEKKDGVVKRQQHLQVSQLNCLCTSLSFSPCSVLLNDIFVPLLMGHSQLAHMRTHMRIRYHFRANLHVTETR